MVLLGEHHLSRSSARDRIDAVVVTVPSQTLQETMYEQHVRDGPNKGDCQTHHRS